MTEQTEAPETEAKAEKPKRVKIEQNGVTKPSDGTKTASVWDISDKLSKDLDRTPARSEVLELTRAQGINDKTTSTQYQRWRRFHGITGRTTIPKAPEEEAPAEAAS